MCTSSCNNEREDKRRRERPLVALHRGNDTKGITLLVVPFAIARKEKTVFNASYPELFIRVSTEGCAIEFDISCKVNSFKGVSAKFSKKKRALWTE